MAVSITLDAPGEASVSAAALYALDADALDAFNIAVGELAFALRADDPRRAGVCLIQGGIDALWAARATLDELAAVAS
jgi:hypothetical protein